MHGAWYAAVLKCRKLRASKKMRKNKRVPLPAAVHGACPPLFCRSPAGVLHHWSVRSYALVMQFKPAISDRRTAKRRCSCLYTATDVQERLDGVSPSRGARHIEARQTAARSAAYSAPHRGALQMRDVPERYWGIQIEIGIAIEIEGTPSRSRSRSRQRFG